MIHGMVGHEDAQLLWAGGIGPGAARAVMVKLSLARISIKRLRVEPTIGHGS